MGVLLVRLGGYAVGVFSGTRLVESKVGARNVHGRNRAGGQSQRRFERRREGQARVATDAAAEVAAKVLLAHADDLDAIVLGGDRFALAAALEDPRLRRFAAITSRARPRRARPETRRPARDARPVPRHDPEPSASVTGALSPGRVARCSSPPWRRGSGSA